MTTDNPVESIADIDPRVGDYRIIDTDIHTRDTLDDLSRYIDDDSPWKRRFESGDDNYEGGAVFWPKSIGSRTRFDRIKREHVEKDWSADMTDDIHDFLGTDASIILGMQQLNVGPMVSQFEDGRWTAQARAYMRYMLDQVVDPANDTYTMVNVPYTEPQRAAELIDDWADEKGVVAACLVTPGAEPPLGDEKYDPIYQSIEDNGLPLVYHSGGAGLNEYQQQGYEKVIETHSLGFMSANMSQLTSIVLQGIPERYPDIDMVFQESGIAYVPGLMYRLDAEYMKRQDEAPLLQKRPSEYMKDIYYGTQPLEEPPNWEYLEQLMEMMGAPDNLMFASDYPHWDYDPPNTITQIPFLSKDEKRKIFSGNAEEVFGI
jgi:predicted TIM-barrel fold metal-dependent hydrolase